MQIQILLHLFRLCHPTSYPVAESTEGKSASPKKRKQRDQPPTLSLEDKLESLMDKLAMWQLLRSIDNHGTNPSGNGKLKDGRDWMQIFYEGVVQETFVHPLPIPFRVLTIRPGILGSASCNQICANCSTAKSFDTPYFLMTRTRELPHQRTRNEKPSVKKLYQPHHPVPENHL